MPIDHYEYNMTKGVLLIELDPFRHIAIQDKTTTPGSKIHGPTVELLKQLRSHRVDCISTANEPANDPTPLIILAMKEQWDKFIAGVATFDNAFSNFLKKIQNAANANVSVKDATAQPAAKKLVDAKKEEANDAKAGLSGALKFTAFSPPAAEPPVGIQAVAAPVGPILTAKK